MDHWVFGDESGNFDFTARGTRYFAVGTLSVTDAVATSLRAQMGSLRNDLAASRVDHDGVFHASKDRQAIRDLVFPLIVEASPRCDVTILEKAKARTDLRESDATFYKYAWYYHLRYVLRYAGRPGDCVHVVLADMGTKKTRAAFRVAVEDVLRQLGRPSVRHDLAFWKPGAHDGLQAADYVLWAVMRQVEQGDPRSKKIIGHLLKSEFSLFG
ncbi:MAG: DUF3800 domain-containing protein [Acidimicrobiales bacterium]